MISWKHILQTKKNSLTKLICKVNEKNGDVIYIYIYIYMPFYGCWKDEHY